MLTKVQPTGYEDYTDAAIADMLGGIRMSVQMPGTKSLLTEAMYRLKERDRDDRWHGGVQDPCAGVLDVDYGFGRPCDVKVGIGGTNCDDDEVTITGTATIAGVVTITGPEQDVERMTLLDRVRRLEARIR